MKKLRNILLVFITLLFTVSSYGATYYSGIKFSNEATDEYVATWEATGKQWEWHSINALVGTVMGSNTLLYVNNSGTLTAVSIGADNTLLFSTGATGTPEARAIEYVDLPSLSALNLTALTAEPTEVVGRIYKASDPWNPSGLPGSPPDDYFVLCTATDTYVALFDITGDFKFASIAAPMAGWTTAANKTLVAADMNKIGVVTAAADIQILADQCDTATFKWITIKQTGVFEAQIELLDAADDFYLSTGVKVEGSTNELETAGASGNQITLMCIVANQWWITGEVGTSADAGAID